jgi:hypothetical protein
MKKALNKLFKKTNVEMILVALGVVLSIQFLIFPGLTAPNTLMNIGAGLGALVLALFLYYYLLPSEEPIEEVHQGETELDYINPEELKPKKKRNPKQFPEVKSEETFVKTRKKKKSEYPLPPHHSNKKK